MRHQFLRGSYGSGGGPAPATWDITIDTNNSLIGTEFGINSFRGDNNDGYIDWGDGSAEEPIGNLLVHTYPVHGVYTIKLRRGPANTGFHPRLTNSDYRDCVIAIGSSPPGWVMGQGQGFDLATICTNLVSVGDLDVSGVTSLRVTFRNCTSLATMGAISGVAAVDNIDYFLEGVLLVDWPVIEPFSAALTSAGTAIIQNSSIANIPAGMFANATLTTLNLRGAALTAQSCENVLVDLDTRGLSTGLLQINVGSNAGESAWSATALAARDSLLAKGWTIQSNA